MRTIKYLLLILPFAAFMVYECYLVEPDVLKHWLDYKWVAAGLAIFFLINLVAKKNMSFVKVFTHELAHTIVCLLFNRKIISFNAKENEGVIWHNSGHSFAEPFIALAPYCLPYFTYLMLIIWSLVATKEMVATGALYGIDILIGFTLGLHISCAHEQTGNHQPDMRQFPLVFSYIYIWSFRIFNILILLLTFLPNGAGTGPNKVWGAFFYIGKSLWQLILSWF